MLPLTGERFIPGMQGAIVDEHLHRYALAYTIASGKIVLDVASGEGYGSYLLSYVAESVIGVDISHEAIHHSSNSYQKPNLRYLQGDCCRLPLADNSIDLVVSFETIEHHDQHEKMLQEIKRVLRPDGLLLISSPNKPEYNKTLNDSNPFHIKELDYKQFTDLLDAHFSHRVIYGQRVLSGSIITPHDNVSSSFLGFYDDETIHKIHGLDRPIYFIALASDSDLPSLETSVYESQLLAEKNHAPPYLEARLYISEAVGGDVRPYTEERGAAVVYPLDGTMQSIDLVFPSDLKQIDRLRLDIANAPTAIRLQSVSLFQAGNQLWNWDGDVGIFANMYGVVSINDQSGTILFCLDYDPQFELEIPSAILDLISGEALLRLEMTPMNLLDQLPKALESVQTIMKGNLPVLSTSRLPVGISDYLQELADLLKIQIDRKNSTISVQQAEIQSLRARQQQLYEQVIRAEAQLELLKEFVFPATSGRIERL